MKPKKNKKNNINIGLIGFGIVGKGVAEILAKNRAEFKKRVGSSISVKTVCDVRKAVLKGAGATKNYRDIINDKDIDIVVELIGGYEPAADIILSSLRAGKNVVTANKAVLAKYWNKIFSSAREHSKLVYFEASVAGAVPIIQGLNEGMAANKIEKIIGILNGTTNYILTEMESKNLSFDAALAKAKQNGFAEADASFDINGTDTAHKLSILSSLAWSSWVRLENISVRGIKDVSLEDIYFAKKKFGCKIKLIGSAAITPKGAELCVEPCLIAEGHPFSNVKNEYNAVLINGDLSKDVMFYGKGAGRMPAASSVVSDIIYLASQIVCGTDGKLPYVPYEPGKKLKLLSYSEGSASYYLRFTAADKSGVLSKISGILGKYNVSIASVYQETPINKQKKGVPIIMLTHKCKIGNLKKALDKINKFPFIVAKTVKYKIEN